MMAKTWQARAHSPLPRSEQTLLINHCACSPGILFDTGPPGGSSLGRSISTELWEIRGHLLNQREVSHQSWGISGIRDILLPYSILGG